MISLKHNKHPEAKQISSCPYLARDWLQNSVFIIPFAVRRKPWFMKISCINCHRYAKERLFLLTQMQKEDLMYTQGELFSSSDLAQSPQVKSALPLKQFGPTGFRKQDQATTITSSRDIQFCMAGMKNSLVSLLFEWQYRAGECNVQGKHRHEVQSTVR